jgi:NACHT domain-containing protein
VEIVCFFRPFYLPIYQLILRFRSGCRKEHSVVRGFSHASDRVFILLISSAIIEDVKNTREDKSALIAYYYFDFKDTSKRGLRGLLTSLLLQLGDHSDRCQHALYKLYTSCRDGSEQPSNAALAKCLKAILELPGQLPTFLIVDALDECPNTSGTPSAREEVLEFLEDLVGSGHPNLFVCVTSRPEQDIQRVLTPLTSASRLVSLHEEGGQREDIQCYIRSFVHKDRSMQRWRAEDRELVITTLSERAGGM